MMPGQEIFQFFDRLSHPENHTSVGSHVHQDTEQSSPPEPFSPPRPSLQHSQGDGTAKEMF